MVSHPAGDPGLGLLVSHPGGPGLGLGRLTLLMTLD